jgi:hypothetical protein
MAGYFNCLNSTLVDKFWERKWLMWRLVWVIDRHEVGWRRGLVSRGRWIIFFVVLLLLSC